MSQPNPEKLMQLLETYRSFHAETCSKNNITVEELEMMIIIQKGGAKKMKDIGDFLGIKSSTLTNFVDKMEEQGFMKRAFSKEDRRAIWVSLNKKGQKLLEQYEGHVQKLVAEYH